MFSAKTARFNGPLDRASAFVRRDKTFLDVYHDYVTELDCENYAVALSAVCDNYLIVAASMFHVAMPVVLYIQVLAGDSNWQNGIVQQDH